MPGIGITSGGGGGGVTTTAGGAAGAAAGVSCLGAGHTSFAAARPASPQAQPVRAAELSMSERPESKPQVPETSAYSLPGSRGRRARLVDGRAAAAGARSRHQAIRHRRHLLAHDHLLARQVVPHGVTGADHQKHRQNSKADRARASRPAGSRPAASPGARSAPGPTADRPSSPCQHRGRYNWRRRAGTPEYRQHPATGRSDLARSPRDSRLRMRRRAATSSIASSRAMR